MDKVTSLVTFSEINEFSRQKLKNSKNFKNFKKFLKKKVFLSSLFTSSVSFL